MNAHAQELESALALIREALQVKQPLNRYHARAVLLPLGALLSAPDATAGRSAAATVSGLTRPVHDVWRKAVEDELEMAIVEFAMSVDRRYLTRPDYDFRYTLEARRLVTERLTAMKELGIALPIEGERALARADRELAPYLERRSHA